MQRLFTTLFLFSRTAWQQLTAIFILNGCFLVTVFAAPPAAPVIRVAITAQQVDVDFDAVNGLNYQLYYALYPQQLDPLNLQKIALTDNHFDFSPLAADQIFVVAVTATNASNEESPFSNVEWVSLNQTLSGSAVATSTDISVNAYNQVISNLSPEITNQREAGRQAFNRQYDTDSGLGVHYNEAACSSCHQNNGRGNTSQGLVFLINSARDVDTFAPLPIPDFGLQLQDKTTDGSKPRAEISISDTFTTNKFADGIEYELRRSIYNITPFKNLPFNTLFSPRIAPALHGIGLLALVSDQTILDLVAQQAVGQFDINNDGVIDPDTDPDVITGKVNRLGNGEAPFGRFGLKAERLTLFEQIQTDFKQSMGIDETEQNNDLILQITRYLQTLAVPQRRNLNDPRVKNGQLLFALAKCATCHYPTLKTGISTEYPTLSEQVIHPYTDLLLHDMGSSLADGRPTYSANAQEWRTPALWGIGLRTTVNGEANYLHDGRARTIIEAIMWHGGEATSAREYVNNLSQQARDNLILFIQSL